MQQHAPGAGYREWRLHFASAPGEDLEPGTRPLIGVGDSLWLRVDSYQCSGDICGGDAARATGTRSTWHSSVPHLATVDSTGLLVGREAGTTRITAEREGMLLSQDVRVLPPVGGLAWEPYPDHVHQGDTLRLVAVARDAAGMQLATVPLAYLQGAVDHPPQPRAGDTLVVVPSEAGTLRIVALLGRRRAEAVIVVEPAAAP